MFCMLALLQRWIMQWLEDYQLFLLDFDGLLVNTEELHYLAYKEMCKRRNIDLTWSFDRYCQNAHYSSDVFRIQIYQEFPELEKQEPHWPNLYEEKKQILIKFIENNQVQLMPGVKEFLNILLAFEKNHCVVTNSPDAVILKLKEQIPELRTIPHWLTRESYTHAKPHPECYIKAVEMYSKPNERVIGFEDSPRGMRALMGAGVKAVMITKAHYPEIQEFLSLGALHFDSLKEIYLI